MCKKNKIPLWILSLIIMFGVISALTPISDIDSDGYYDSLITEGLLLFSIISPLIDLSARQHRISAAELTAPRILSHPFLHPPTLAN